MAFTAILSSNMFLNTKTEWLKRKAKEGKFEPEKVEVTEGLPAIRTELISNAIFGFIIGFKLLYILNNFPRISERPW